MRQQPQSELTPEQTLLRPTPASHPGQRTAAAPARASNLVQNLAPAAPLRLALGHLRAVAERVVEQAAARRAAEGTPGVLRVLPAGLRLDLRMHRP